MATSKAVISFRGTKVEIPLFRDEESFSSLSVTVGQVKEQLAIGDQSQPITGSDIKLLFRGKVLNDNAATLEELLLDGKKTTPKSMYRLVAMGVSRVESQQLEDDRMEQLQKNKVLVRDDLSTQGQVKEQARRRLGRLRMLQASASTTTTKRGGGVSTLGKGTNYGFERIEILPNLQDQDKAHAILTKLSKDPGILACMAKHQWKVGSLAELPADGNVGQSAVCVMGLNRNKGQQILLRLRTDDYRGFRKELSIREVLFHELAHNVHSDHGSQFFQLMRQIKQECLELDWTKGTKGTSTGVEKAAMERIDYNKDSGQFMRGGTYTLGGDTSRESGSSTRQLAAKAAMERLTTDEKEVQQNCGCGQEHSLFLPAHVPVLSSERRNTNPGLEPGDTSRTMDAS